MKLAFHRSKEFVADMTVCTLHMHNGDEIGLSPRRRAIVRALLSQATPRQREVLYLYYGMRMNQAAIAHKLGLEASTISRTIRRGERCAELALSLIADN